MSNPVGRPKGKTGMTENQLKIRREKLLIKLMTHSIDELDGNRWEKKKEKKEDEHKRY